MPDDEERIEKAIRGGIEEIEEITKERKKLTEELELFRKDRAEVLVNFVNIVKSYLKSSYEMLTEQEDGSTGTVNFHMESEDEPFEHGIYFTPTPPTKRFVYDLEQLSGGEKSVASLALQYSLSLASKSPLLILDETDAFLDLGNVNRFLNLINSSMKSTALFNVDHKLQIIAVTHKQSLFSRSESLVGVSRPKSLNMSQVYSLRLDDN
jgi:structural maintenance of chromosome 1